MVTEKCGAGYNFVLATLTFSCFCWWSIFAEQRFSQTNNQTVEIQFLPTLSDFSHISSYSTTDYLPTFNVSLLTTILKLQGVSFSYTVTAPIDGALEKEPLLINRRKN